MMFSRGMRHARESLREEYRVRYSPRTNFGKSYFFTLVQFNDSGALPQNRC